MVIFTEHNEVIMSLDDMRKMIRYCYNSGNEDCKNHPNVPVDWRCEFMERFLEEILKKTQQVPELSQWKGEKVK